MLWRALYSADIRFFARKGCAEDSALYSIRELIGIREASSSKERREDACALRKLSRNQNTFFVDFARSALEREASSHRFSGRTLRHNRVRSVRFGSNVEKHLRLPAAIMFLDGETMKRDRFHISALLMTSRI
jgi:hypothetical protein